MSPEQVPAERQDARQLWRRDACALAHGITVEDAGDGHARLRMPVRPDMTNGHGICHGGIIFLLADTALAYASVAPGPTQTNVAASATITFTRPAHPGEVLLATCRRLHQQGRSGLYDVQVTTQAGEPVAFFRGQVILTQRRGSE
jgi:acyl-CoA thioesterase